MPAVISERIGDYILKGANYFHPYEITHNNFTNLDSLLKIAKKAKFSKPDLQKINYKHLALYLAS